MSNTSPLCNLASPAHFWILRPLYQTVIIPQAVADELRQARAPKIQAILTLEWIEIRTLSDTTLALTLKARSRPIQTGVQLSIEFPQKLNERANGNLNNGFFSIINELSQNPIRIKERPLRTANYTNAFPVPRHEPLFRESRTLV